MARDLTTPVSQADINQQAVTKLEVRVAHKKAAGGQSVELDKANITVRYEVTTYANGEPVSVAAREASFPAWPAALATDVKAVYQKAVTDAESRGLIGPGTDEPLDQ